MPHEYIDALRWLLDKHYEGGVWRTDLVTAMLIQLLIKQGR